MRRTHPPHPLDLPFHSIKSKAFFFFFFTEHTQVCKVLGHSPSVSSWQRWTNASTCQHFDRLPPSPPYFKHHIIRQSKKIWVYVIWFPPACEHHFHQAREQLFLLLSQSQLSFFPLSSREDSLPMESCRKLKLSAAFSKHYCRLLTLT